MSPKFLKPVAIAMLALAIAALVAALRFSNQRVDIQGPSALAVLDDQSVWLSVDEALWHLNAQGQRVASTDAQTLNQGGLSGLIGNLVVHPNGQLVASVRDDPKLYFLDPASGKVLSHLLPQWPADLERHGARAITYAFASDGRVAISTGGGHTVALFDAQGRFLARTAPNTYTFTNGLWWTSDSLWTTNTNGMALVELDPSSLAVKSQVQLTRPVSKLSGQWGLGMAVASASKPATSTQERPIATLVRFANGMVEGHATDVLPDGTQIDFPTVATLEPRDIKWRGAELLLVDGASYAIKRYSDTHLPLADFASSAVQTELADLLARRASLQKQYWLSLAAAIALFAVGLVAAVIAQHMEKQQSLAALHVDLSQMGTPRLSRLQYLQAAWKFYGAAFLLVALALLLQLAWPLYPAMTQAAKLPLLLICAVTVLLILDRIVRKDGRGVDDPAVEAFFNYRAMQLLGTDLAFWRMLHSREHPRETLMLLGSKHGLLWLVLTNQRLLIFVGNLKERRLLAQHPRRSISDLRMVEQQDLNWQQRLLRGVLPGAVTLHFRFNDGSSLQGAAHSAVTAKRLTALLQASAFEAPSISQMGQAMREQARSRATMPGPQEALRQTLASLLVPGLGQWMQQRNAAALRYFLAWALLLVFGVIPVVWTLWAPRATVPLPISAGTAALYALLSLMAAADSWRLQLRRA